MKKKHFAKKLVLKKETIAGLDNQTMNAIRGGQSYWYTDCNPCDTLFESCRLCPVRQSEYETCITGWCAC
jgi:hypothetical protein